MLVKLQGIVLHTVKFRDNSLITTLYTDKSGRQSCILNSVRKKGEPGRAGLLQPMNIIDIEVYQRQTRDIQRIREIKNACPWLTIPFDIQKTTQMLFIAEILFKTVKEEESNPALFNFLVDSLALFDSTEKGKGFFHVCFLAQLTEFLGILPDLQNKTGGWFDMKKGIIVSKEPSHPLFMNRETTMLLQQLISMKYLALDQLLMTKSQKELLLAQLIDYYHLHFETLGSVKSLAVLKEVFQS